MPGDVPLSRASSPVPGSIEALYLRYQQLKTLDDYKNDLIKELLHLCKNNEDLYKQEARALALEMEMNRNPQIREVKLQDTVKQMKELMNRNSFLLLLVDGNQVIFRDDLLQSGEQGGKDAAILLWNTAIEYLKLHPSIPSTSKVVTRIYSNVENLSQRLKRSGALQDASLLDAFIRGFMTGAPLFDVINVPGPEEMVVEKVRSTFQLHLHDCHCRRIIFGCSQSSEYNNLLLDTIKDPGTLTRVAFMDEEPLDPTHESASFARLLQFSNIDKIRPDPLRIDTPLPAADGKPLSPKGFPSLPAAQVASFSGSTASNSPAPTWASAAAKPYHTITPLIFPTAKSTIQAALMPTTILRNRKGQRIDPLIPCTREEIQRLKNLKLCNVHFLRGDCPHGTNCTHIHRYKPTTAELQTLRYVARMAPCLRGSTCEDVKCIYGHICPAAEGRHGDKCTYGAACRFSDELHGIDRMSVKTFKV